MVSSLLGFEVFSHRLPLSHDFHPSGPFVQLLLLVSTSLGWLTATFVQISVQLAVLRSHGDCDSVFQALKRVEDLIC